MKTETVIQGAVALTVIGLGVFAVWKLGGFGKGLLTGDNALTQNARDSDGNKIGAYTGVPVVGTLGAAANAASGGYLATFGGWLGRSAYDLLHPEGEPSTPQASYDETERLLARYPGTNEPSGILGGWSDTPGIY